jgi:hypothetical protein
MQPPANYKIDTWTPFTDILDTSSMYFVLMLVWMFRLDWPNIVFGQCLHDAESASC